MKRIIFFIVLFVSAFSLAAQSELNTMPPVDTAYRIGKLENGLTYYIRHNTEPAGRASYYIIQNVGAILENDSQNGLAHFLEHMAFNGTSRFPDKAILNKLARHGVAFGYNINAYTSWDETVYNLSDVPVDKPGLVDTCLTILADWSDFITLKENEIDLERGVIIEEWRTRENANSRMTKKLFPVMFEGSKYAVRDIIGDTLILKTFSPDTLRSFYHDWYRTDLQVIAVVGDIHVDEVEAKIKSIFSSIPAVKNAKPRRDFTVPAQKGTRYVLATDPEAPGTSVNLFIMDENPDNRPRDLTYMRDMYVTDMMNSVMSNRISELLQKGTPPFIAASVNYGGFVPRNYNVLSVAAQARGNEEAKAFEAVLTEMERARRHGFTQGELNRVKSTMLANYESAYKQKDKIKNDTYADDIQSHFLTGEPLPSIDFEFDFFKKILPLITLDDVNRKFRSVVRDDNRVILISGPEGVDHMTQDEALALVSKVEKADIKPYDDVTGGTELISETLPGSAVIKSIALPQFGAVEWTLGNGAKVVFRKADYEKDNVTLSANAFGGASVYADSLIPSLSVFPTVISMYGAGEFDNVALQKMLAGKKASVSLGLQETQQSVSGTSTPGDFETMMQLLYLRFAKPNFNREAYNAIVGRYTAMVTAMQKDPNKMMSDSLTLNMTGYSPRTFVMTPESMKKIRFEDVNYIYKNTFDDASAFIFFIVGNIDETVARAMTEKYIGSLPSTHAGESWIDRGVRQPVGKVIKEIPIPLTVPKATVVMSYTAKTKYKPENNLSMEVMKGILDLVYTEKVREDEGGTYGVSVNSTTQLRPVSKSVLMVAFECDPVRASDLKAIIYSELNEIAKNGPSQVNLDKAVSNMLKKREEALPHNNYWASTIRNYYVTGINSDDPRNFTEILNSMTPKDIRKTVSKYLKKADLLEIVFVPEKK
ncbi:MAG TPA: insulinase family protein [Bacteroidales bacterium]|nr:insulinase family protein [Bacteroidales bacterium]